MRDQHPSRALATARQPDLPAESNSRLAPARPQAPPFRPYQEFAGPILRALHRRLELRALARMLGMDPVSVDVPEALVAKTDAEQRAKLRGRLDEMDRTGRFASRFPSRRAALSFVDELARAGTLAEFSETIANGRQCADGKHILAEISVMLSTSATPRATSPNFASAVLFELDLADASRGAVTLACRDCGTSPERRFGAPEVGEILDNAARREHELAEMAAIVGFLADLAPNVGKIIAEEDAIAQAAAEAAERERLAEEARAAEAARRSAVREAAFRISNDAPAALLAEFTPDILNEARALIAAAEDKHLRQAAEFAAQRAAAEADRAEKARVADETLRAETHSLIAQGKFNLAQTVGWKCFADAADAFEANPDADPETLEALRAFRQADAAAMASSSARLLAPHSNRSGRPN